MPSVSSIRNIIFDLGGVLLEIDYDKTTEAFRKLGLKKPEEAFTKYRQAELFQEFEKGNISAASFINQLHREIPHTSEAKLTEAWCAMLGNMPNISLTILEKLKARGYRIFLLSNTNSIHKEAFEKHIRIEHGAEKFFAPFERVYYSHMMGMRKPDKIIFETVLTENNLKAEETLFIDDTEGHIAGALKVGIRGLHLKKMCDLPSLLREAGLQIEQ